MKTSGTIVVVLFAVALGACGASAPRGDRADPPPAAAQVQAAAPVSASASGAGGAWYRDAVFYEVFVRSFRDSDGDGVGDIPGLIERLDYLNDGDPETTDDLGVTALWLMPVNESPSYHGYDVVDYRAIDEDYGTLADFDRLLVEARKRGIRVVMDLVMNHTSSQHPWFLDARRGPDAPRRDWYVWSDSFVAWDRPWGPGPTWHRAGESWFYGLFWEGMPDLNYANDAVRREMTDIARFWLDRGVDGFRLDAVRYLVETGSGSGQSDTPETHAYWRELRAAIATKYPDALLVGEAWCNRDEVIPYHGAGDEMHMTFDFDLQTNLTVALRMAAPGAVRDSLVDALRRFPEHAHRGIFLANHDMPRIATKLDRDPGALRLAAALLLTLPGTPFLYYGEEIGLPNGPMPNDEAKRQPMRWSDGPAAGFTTAAQPWQPAWSGAEAPSVAAQRGAPDSLLSHYRRWTHLRQAHPALRSGRTEVLPEDATSSEAVLALLRVEAGETLLVLHNFGREPVVGLTVRVTGVEPARPGTIRSVRDVLGAPGAVMSGTPDVSGGTGTSRGSGVVTVPRLPARGSAVIAID